MKKWHVPGQKVVYVDGSGRAFGDKPDPLREGGHYTISKVRIVCGDVLFQVEEWDDPYFFWSAARFDQVHPAKPKRVKVYERA